MTEKEWRRCGNPFEMLRFLQSKASERTLRLFIVACCRLYWELFVDPRAHRAVEVAELFADGLATEDERATAQAACQEANHTFTEFPIWSQFAAATRAVARTVPETESEHVVMYGYTGAVAAIALCHVLIAAGSRRPLRRVSRGRGDSKRLSFSLKRFRRTLAECAALLREILVNPFRPATVNPTWLSWHNGLLVSMAQCMYDVRDFCDMPVLADALEEAGCTNADILNHCRQPGEHVRGCWVVDLLLNKS